jgi:hypothetical protein
LRHADPPDEDDRGAPLCDGVPHMIIRLLRLQPEKFVVGETKRLLQHNLPEADIVDQFVPG